jgi:Fe-S-cluster containining protein
MIRLKRSYTPPSMPTLALKEADPRIFMLRTYADCMGCSFCEDACCAFGADVSLREAERIRSQMSLVAEEWFAPDVVVDMELGGLKGRTLVKDGACAFLDRERRGCLIHAFALRHAIPLPQIKPIVCSLFPLTFDQGILMPSQEVLEQSLICGGAGPSLYDGAREMLLLYFGEELVAELDEVNHERREEGAAHA